MFYKVLWTVRSYFLKFEMKVIFLLDGKPKVICQEVSPLCYHSAALVWTAIDAEELGSGGLKSLSENKPSPLTLQVRYPKKGNHKA